MMDGPHGAVPTLGGGDGVVHGTNLVGAAGRGSIVWTVGCVGVMASQKITVCCDRASSFLLEFFSKGADGWDFCRTVANYLVILMALSVDDSKGVKKRGKLYCIGDALTACF